MQIVVGHIVRCNERRARSALDRHVAQSHALFHIEHAYRRAGVFERVPRAARDAELADQEQYQVLGGHAGLERAFERHAQGGGLALHQRLCREHVLHLAGADAPGVGAEGADSTRMTVPAHERRAGQRDPELGRDHVHDALPGVVDIEKLNAVGARVGAQRAYQFRAARHGRIAAAGLGRDEMVLCGEGELRIAYGTPGAAQPVESLRTGEIVDQVAIDMQQCTAVAQIGDHMVAPDLFEQRLRCGHRRAYSSLG